MNEVGFCPVVSGVLSSGVLSCGVLSVWGFVLWGFVRTPCYTLVKTRSQYYFSLQSYGILKTVKSSNLRVQNNEKMAIKEKDPYFNII